MVFAINQCGVPAGFGLAGVIFRRLLRAIEQLVRGRWWCGGGSAGHYALIPPMRAALDSDPANRRPRLAGRAFGEPGASPVRCRGCACLVWLGFFFHDGADGGWSAT